MKRVSILIACTMIWLLPASQAMAGTWSWHSDLIEKIIEVIESGKDVRMEGTSPAAPIHNRQKDRSQRANGGRHFLEPRPQSYRPQ